MPSATTQFPQPIIDLILADINAIIPNFTSLVSSYRLLVGAAEEIHRTPTVCPDVFERAVRRYDNAGTLIDVLLELLCCKIAFSSEFLQVSGAPVDLFRLISNPTVGTDTPFHSAEQVVVLEMLAKIMERYQQGASCLPNYQVVCPPTEEQPAPSTTPTTPAAPATPASTTPPTSRTAPPEESPAADPAPPPENAVPEADPLPDASLEQPLPEKPAPTTVPKTPPSPDNTPPEKTRSRVKRKHI